MIVDDEAVITVGVMYALQRAFGSVFNYCLSFDPLEAIDLIDRRVAEDIRIALILSDWSMPGLKGDEMLAAIDRQHPGISSVLLSASISDEASARAGELASFLGCLQKPFSLPLFVRLVDGRWPLMRMSDVERAGETRVNR